MTLFGQVLGRANLYGMVIALGEPSKSITVASGFGNFVDRTLKQ